MKRILFAIVITFSPFLLFAQSEGQLVEGFYQDIYSRPSALKINDNLFVMQVNTSKESFDIVGVNENLQQLWKVTIDGYGVKLGKFKNKVLAIAATEHSTMMGNGNTYKGVMIDPATGKKLVEKIIFDDKKDYYEIPIPVIKDNAFKLGIRETNVTRSVKLALPGPLMLFSIFHAEKQFVETQKFQIEDFNENLDVVSTIDAPVNDRYIDLSCNNNGDSFLTWMNGSDIEVYKYPAGQTTSTMHITGDVSFADIKSWDEDGPSIKFETSKTNPNLLFYTAIYRNPDHETELMLGKMDFSNGKKSSVTQVFTKDDLKALEKSYVPVSKKLKDADLGTPKEMNLNNFLVGDNIEVISLQSVYEFSSSNGNHATGYGVIYNVFDENLQMKFQQIFPETYKYETKRNPESAHIEKDKLYILGYHHKGGLGFDNVGLFGTLDLATGQWDKVETISDKMIEDEMSTNATVWLKDYFIVPYFKSHGMFGIKYDVDLQQNQY